MKIEFVNHASVKIYTSDAVILTDPWYSGSVFDDGWDLLVEGPADLPELLSDVTHIWVSHEHPDHFSPAFFLGVPDERKEDLVVLFQKTVDGRVVGFLKQKGFRVEELTDDEPLTLGTHTEITCAKSEFYDSFLHVKDGTQTLLNLNDCPLSDDGALRKIRGRFGSPDVLLTQFSYAAWKGGRDNREFRVTAAAEKLNTVATQVRALGAKALVPFASFVYFSNEENDYLNDGVNTPDTVVTDCARYDADVIVMQPGEQWEIGAPHDNSSSLDFWRAQFQAIPERPRRAPNASVSLETLEKDFDAYRARVFQENSYSIAYLARHNPVIRGFLPVRIFLADLDETIEVSVMDGFRHCSSQADIPPDVFMHSTSLQFIFKNSFGFDTLTVNGRFEATPGGFSKMTRSFAIGSLNAMGITLGYATIFRADLIVRLLSRLMKVQRKLKS